MRHLLPAAFRWAIGVGENSRERLRLDSALQALKCVPPALPQAGNCRLITEKAFDKRGRPFDQLTLKVTGGNSIEKMVEALKKIDPDALTKVTKLVIVESSAVYLKGIEQLKNLVHLKIESPELVSIAGVEDLKKLRVVSFADCKGLQDIRPLQFTNIQSLNISGTRCNNTSVGALIGIPNLRLVNAQHTKVSMGNAFERFRSPDISLLEISEETRKFFARNFNYNNSRANAEYTANLSARVRGIPLAEVRPSEETFKEFKKIFGRHLIKLKTGKIHVVTDDSLAKRLQQRRQIRNKELNQTKK